MEQVIWVLYDELFYYNKHEDGIIKECHKYYYETEEQAINKMVELYTQHNGGNASSRLLKRSAIIQTFNSDGRIHTLHTYGILPERV